MLAILMAKITVTSLVLLAAAITACALADSANQDYQPPGSLWHRFGDLVETVSGWAIAVFATASAVFAVATTWLF